MGRGASAVSASGAASSSGTRAMPAIRPGVTEAWCMRGSSAAAAANADAARRRRLRWIVGSGLLEVVQHPVDRELDLLVGQCRVAALGRHHPAIGAGEALDRVAVQRVLALGDARI